MRHAPRSLLAALITPLLAGPAAGQGAPTVSLGAPSMTFPEPFSRLAALAELADGRLVVVDSRERSIQIADPRGGSLAPVSRHGEGPREYQAPFGVVAGRGDTLLVYDAGNRRYLRIAPDGTQGDDIPIPMEILNAGGLAPARGVDRQGRIYWLGDIIYFSPGGTPKRQQHHRVRRWMPGTDRLDTVAVIADHATALHDNRFHPFAERDAHVVTRDGRVGVLSAAEFRLRWYVDGREAGAGPRIPFAPVPVTPAERVAFRVRQAASPAGSARSSGGAAPSAGQRARSMEELYPDAAFPAQMPPFIAEETLVSPGDFIWTTLSAPSGTTRRTVAILTPSGALHGRLTLPEGRRIVALDRNGVYVVRVDEDGLEWLERYAYPSGTR